jgi:hypothetical protein
MLPSFILQLSSKLHYLSMQGQPQMMTEFAKSNLMSGIITMQEVDKHTNQWSLTGKHHKSINKITGNSIIQTGNNNTPLPH